MLQDRRHCCWLENEPTQKLGKPGASEQSAINILGSWLLLPEVTALLTAMLPHSREPDRLWADVHVLPQSPGHWRGSIPNTHWLSKDKDLLPFSALSAESLLGRLWRQFLPPIRGRKKGADQLPKKTWGSETKAGVRGIPGLARWPLEKWQQPNHLKWCLWTSYPRSKLGTFCLSQFSSFCPHPAATPPKWQKCIHSAERARRPCTF